MTENRRILLNVVATYGRSLYGLALGLLCGRWTLMALGEVDYGLYGLVGGLTLFIAFFNTVLAGANARFYAYSVGAAKATRDKEGALEDCRRWFNTAISVHTSLPLLLVAVGYPIGIYAINEWLTIPADRIEACIWAFRFACIACFVGMVNVPFQAMYNAKQYIAELTIYTFVTSTLNVIVLHYMVTHPEVWLVKYAAWACLLSVVPQVIICLRAVRVFPECKITFSYMWDLRRLKELLSYSGWQFLGVLCGLLRTQGMTIVINKFFGAKMNAAQAIGNTVQGQCNTLASAMQTAFAPVIVQACGEGDYEKMNAFVIRTCKFNVFLFLVFAIPLTLELPKVLSIWLVTPPAYLITASTVGHMIAVNATGKIAGYHVILCVVNVFVIPSCIVVGLFHYDVFFMMGIVVFFEILNSIGRIYFAHRYARTSFRAWLRFVGAPAFFVTLIVGFTGWLPRLLLPASLARVCLTVVVCELVLLPMCWMFVLSAEERLFMRERILTRALKVL